MNIPFQTTRSVASSNTSHSSVPLYEMISMALLSLAISFFIISLLNIVFFTSSGDISGFWTLLTGWLGFIVFQFAWFANPLSFLAVSRMKSQPLFALFLSVLAVTLATEGFIFNEIPTASGSEKIFIREFGLGFYFWYGAHWLALCSVLFKLIGQIRRR